MLDALSDDEHPMPVGQHARGFADERLVLQATVDGHGRLVRGRRQRQHAGEDRGREHVIAHQHGEPAWSGTPSRQYREAILQVPGVVDVEGEPQTARREGAAGGGDLRRLIAHDHVRVTDAGGVRGRQGATDQRPPGHLVQELGTVVRVGEAVTVAGGKDDGLGHGLARSRHRFLQRNLSVDSAHPQWPPRS